MSRVIPNENSWIGFATTIAAVAAPTTAELTAAIDLTKMVISINASSQGNSVPTPSLDSLFETSVPGTNQASFTADFYRDDVSDAAWELLTRGKKGFFVISRFGGMGVKGKPIALDNVEVWPIQIISRTAGALSSNTAQTFTCTASVPAEPSEDATVAA